jgi:hypothetical protein
MKKPPKPEAAFRALLASQYPGMSPEMRNGIVGLAIRAFITPTEIASACPGCVNINNACPACKPRLEALAR